MENGPIHAAVDCPRLRAGLAYALDRSDTGFVFLWDQLRLSQEPLRLTVVEFMCVQMFDGRRTLRDLQAEGLHRTGGDVLSFEWIASLAARLDAALLLDSSRFRQYLAAPVREPSCLGCYEVEPSALRRQLTSLFEGPSAPGLPRSTTPDGKLRAALVPHIDYQRGGSTYAWGFKEVLERTDASLFVIIGTSHYSAQRFTLTRRHFKTPLGTVQTDQAYIDRLVAHYGDGLFDDELAHLPEHSIELEVVLLQFLLENRRPFRIVPLVVGSFHDCIVNPEGSPCSRADIGRMVQALRQTEFETKEPICYLISGDLAHLGPRFGDAQPVDTHWLAQSRKRDLAILRRAEAVDPGGYLRLLVSEGDRRRICGFPPTFTLLEAVRPSRGQLLHYDQYAHPQGLESVSFASMAFYR
jgi:AmmeMemoRadiSam system protein B